MFDYGYKPWEDDEFKDMHRPRLGEVYIPFSGGGFCLCKACNEAVEVAMKPATHVYDRCSRISPKDAHNLSSIPGADDIYLLCSRLVYAYILTERDQRE
jgi:hypothetical protein